MRMIRKILIIGPGYMKDEIESYRVGLTEMLKTFENHHVFDPLIIQASDDPDYIHFCYKEMYLANVLIIFVEDGYQDLGMSYITAYARNLIDGPSDPTVLFVRGGVYHDHESASSE